MEEESKKEPIATEPENVYGKFKYSVKLAGETPGQTVILKENISFEFTLDKVEEDIRYLNKKRIEIEATAGISAAKITNITEHHPYVKDMDPKKLLAFYMYHLETQIQNELLDKLQEVDNQLKEYAAEKSEILKQTGVAVVPEAPKPEAEAPAAPAPEAPAAEAPAEAKPEVQNG